MLIYTLYTLYQVSLLTEPANKELGSVEIPFAEVLQAPGRLMHQEYMLEGTLCAVVCCYLQVMFVVFYILLWCGVVLFV